MWSLFNAFASALRERSVEQPHAFAVETMGQWKSASSFGRDDLLVVGEVTRMAFHRIHRQYQQKNGAGQQEEAQDASYATGDDQIPF